MYNLRYPIGEFESPKVLNLVQINTDIERIERLPLLVKNQYIRFNNKNLQDPYRPDGWNAKQLIHHLAESHMNAYCRFKLALTEEKPVIKPYDQNKWCVTADNELTSPEVSISILVALHQKWTTLLRSMNEIEWGRTFYHPEYDILIPLYESVAQYAWHGEHHSAHLQLILDNN